MTENSLIHASTEKLSIADKYFSLKKEQRINRMQFFVRNILILVTFLISIIIPVSLLMVPTMIYVVCITVNKRANDFNYNGLYYAIVYFICVCISFITPFFLTAYIFMHSWGWDFNKNDPILHRIGMLTFISMFTLIILWGILQLRKWNPGNNQYGPAPTGNPLV